MRSSTTQRQAPRVPGRSVQELLDAERVAIPPALRETAADDVGCTDVKVECFTSQAFFDLEMERMWPRVWQMACRVEEIPRVGDHVVYEIGRYSLLIARSAPDRIQAFHNACLHRGRILRSQSGNVQSFRCPFHGFEWTLDGRLADVPCRWDFPDIVDKEWSLPEARVDTWGGFVFVNMDEDAEPLDAYLAEIPEHFREWALEDRHKVLHVAKVIEANWKVVLEAFIESHHVLATHPQIMPSTGDTNTQYDVSADRPHTNRMITAMAVASPTLGDDYPEQKIVDAMLGGSSRVAAGRTGLVVPEGQTARSFMADLARGAQQAASGLDLSHATDSEMLDAIEYYVFPNFCPWGGYQRNIMYRFRPVGCDPERTLMEAMFLVLPPADGDRPPPSPMKLLETDEKWSSVPELGILGPVFDQDMSNLSMVQKGLRATRKPTVTLARYQESRIRHLHATLDRYVSNP